MNHLNEDTLLKLTLDLLEDEEKTQALSHLSECGECREQFANLKRETDELGGLQPELPEIHYPLPKSKSASKLWLLRAAALLLIGFVSGYGVSHLYSNECMNVFSYSASGACPSVGEDGMVICDSEALQVIVR